MVTLPSSVRIYVAAEPVDLRRGFDGLAATTRSVIGADPMSGHVFVFLNRRRNRVKLLVWDRTGYWLLYKRLERGTFEIPTTPVPGERHVEVDAGDLAVMLEGFDLRGARRRPRWYRAGTANRGGTPPRATAGQRAVQAGAPGPVPVD
jgi:transposase